MIKLGNEGDERVYAAVLECREFALPIKYFGLLLVANYKSSASWDPVLEMSENRLSGWKRKFLSKGEKTYVNKKHHG